MLVVRDCDDAAREVSKGHDEGVDGFNVEEVRDLVLRWGGRKEGGVSSSLPLPSSSSSPPLVSRR